MKGSEWLSKDALFLFGGLLPSAYLIGSRGDPDAALLLALLGLFALRQVFLLRRVLKTEQRLKHLELQHDVVVDALQGASVLVQTSRELAGLLVKALAKQEANDSDAELAALRRAFAEKLQGPATLHVGEEPSA